MKTQALPWLTALALVTAAQAGTPGTVTAPPPAAGLWQWFIGGSAGYLTDLEEGMYGLQVGGEYRAPGAYGTHSVYLQVGYTQDDASYAFLPPAGTTGGKTQAASIDLDIIPITLNYKFEAPIAGRLNYYIGVGLGIAILDSSYDWSWSQVTAPPNPFEGAGSDDETDVRFYGDVTAGLAYRMADTAEIYVGVRYIFMDNVDHPIDVYGAPSYDAGINNDLLIELGLRFDF